MLDLPISLIFYALVWKHSVFAAIWIFVAGTYWWYPLGRGAESLIDSIRHRKPVTLFSSYRSRDKLFYKMSRSNLAEIHRSLDSSSPVSASNGRKYRLGLKSKNAGSAGTTINVFS